MLIRVEQDDGKHINFYEGSHVGFHPEGNKMENGVTIIVEERKNSVTLNIEKGSKTRIFLMNDQGRTIEKVYI